MSYNDGHIENEAAYAAATDRRIKANATKGRNARWLAADSTRAELVEKMRYSSNPFLNKMWQAVDEWGSLTEKQEIAVRASFDRDDCRRAERIAADASSKHIGQEGKREVFTLILKAVFENETDFGLQFTHKMVDGEGNIVTYRGSKRLMVETKRGYTGKIAGEVFTTSQHEVAGKGDTVTMKATVKSHWTSKDGIKQTFLSRPVVVSIEKQITETV